MDWLDTLKRNEDFPKFTAIAVGSFLIAIAILLSGKRLAEVGRYEAVHMEDQINGLPARAVMILDRKTGDFTRCYLGDSIHHMMNVSCPKPAPLVADTESTK